MADHLTLQREAGRDEARGPDFRHVSNWIFDLDNTLYPAASDLFAQIDARMTRFVAELLSIGDDEARAIQKAYYREHGTTLNGLMRLHDVRADTYLSFVHNIDLSVLDADGAMAAQLARLPGRRFIFTNGCANHAERVLEKLGIASLFDDIWDIRTIGFSPKPDPGAYDTILRRAGAAPTACAMFDDIGRNLVPAHALGMTTVWLKNDSPWSKQGPDYPAATRAHIHYETDDLAGFLSSVRVAR